MPTLTRNAAIHAIDGTNRYGHRWVDNVLDQALAVRALNILRSALGLTREEIATMLSNETLQSINESTVHAWETRLTEVPISVSGQLIQDESDCLTLLALYRPERLPEVIRRPAPIFGGATGKSWIIAGRMREASTAYDRALRFQG